MGIQNLLSTLEKQISILEKDLALLPDIPFSNARFDQALFHHHSNKLSGYLQEIKHNMGQLKTCVNDYRIEQVKFLSERLITQIEALKREIATQALRKQEDKFEHRSQERDLYQRLAEHQDYERRLISMIDDRELQLNKQVTLINKSKLQREIAALAGRLARCRQALMRIEKSIEKQENSN
ncbi:primosomal replication protein [Xenorhabdus nematophila]|uniref:Primosomal replication protein N n=1 Tax=Xenorhabdus nematophila (strain ATCC 19061 / DSM 3370 / CCUG 14189 / LMG 1036 / NCIMB 9965 / AN6) TaxID=406817 RepID=D3VL67_XENNA|nr:primosomal replication protein [Xenorhabdus nematophila]CEE92166.1 primosomal replication protein N'' [Xenorhabdus nematophila str. Anatoliense]CEF30612.1 primosomal replication protein N'' [Xenorhabdus nematophila str. Websteri]AYA40983.1 prephenate dehydrogenase [Xenorhabdus nematophila]KHD29394.1 prephenate dehydrogenase [Xenorhabdus nematophila]MBA0019729.1 primosomal replication protein [Xenorhabdus nematophila]